MEINKNHEVIYLSVLGLIVEYNPFHNGHLYHFNTSLNITQAENSVCVISGNFVQRGEPAVVDKWSRTLMALNAGIDLVIELPVSYCVQSAEIFAYGAVTLLNSLGIIDKLCFGSECGDIGLLQNIAHIISDEPDEYKDYLKYEIKTGQSFAASRANAIAKFFVHNSPKGSPNHEQLKFLLQSSNNILAFEYLKWLYRLDSKIEPVTIKRIYSEYNDESICMPYASATAVRKAIKENKLNDLNKILPYYVTEILHNQFKSGKGPIFLEHFSQPLLCILRRLSNADISKIVDVNEGLENKIKKAAIMSSSIGQLICNIKSKRYSETRIRRILINILLGITRDDLNSFKLAGGPQYVRVLGFSGKGKNLINNIKSKCSLPIITNVSEFKRLDNIILKRMMELDILSTDIYVTSYLQQNLRAGGNDFYMKPLIF